VSAFSIWLSFSLNFFFEYKEKVTKRKTQRSFLVPTRKEPKETAR
jgi:hypothetical protein